MSFCPLVRQHLHKTPFFVCAQPANRRSPVLQFDTDIRALAQTETQWKRY